MAEIHGLNMFEPQQPWESFEEYLARLQNDQMMAMSSTRNRQSAPRMPTGIGNLFGGGGGSEPAGAGNIGGVGSGGGGAGMAGIGGIIAAAILGQHLASGATDTKFEGVKTNDVFGGHFATEPWLAFAHDKLGISPTAGERFDAAVDRGDMGMAAKRLPAAADYWADPIRSWLGSSGEAIGTKIAGKTGGQIGNAVFNPIGALLRLFG